MNLAPVGKHTVRVSDGADTEYSQTSLSLLEIAVGDQATTGH
jgi:hypothetical protein